MEDYEKTFKEFWQEILCLPDGSLNLDQVKRELHDYHTLLDNVPKVYSHVTGGLISKPNTVAEAVIAEADDCVNKWVDEMIKEAIDNTVETKEKIDGTQKNTV